MSKISKICKNRKDRIVSNNFEIRPKSYTDLRVVLLPLYA